MTAWRSLPAGPSCSPARRRELEQVSPDFPEAAAAQVRDWQGAVLDLVRVAGCRTSASRARVLSWGVNGAGAAVMVAVFAQTGGLTGGEIAVAGGTTALGQRVLEAVFGDAAVRSLAARAREDLEARADALLRYEQDRFDVLRRRGRARPRRPPRSCAPPSRELAAARRAGRVKPARDPLAERLAALREAVEVADGRLEVPEVGRARALLAKAGARAALGDATVVALAGATGSGKSTLFNALSGSEISTPGRPPADDRRRARHGLGRAATPTGCSTGWRCRGGTGTPPTRRWTGWSCSTCPTTTASGWSTGSRSTGWSGWSTSSSGCSTRRSTPTPRCTTATWRRWPAHAGVLLVVLNQVDRLDAGRRDGLPGRPAGAAGPRGARGHAAAGRLGPHRCRGRRAARRAGPPGGRPAGGRPTG